MLGGTEERKLTLYIFIFINNFVQSGLFIFLLYYFYLYVPYTCLLLLQVSFPHVGSIQSLISYHIFIIFLNSYFIVFFARLYFSHAVPVLW